jgi:hypothetical protein
MAKGILDFEDIKYQYTSHKVTKRKRKIVEEKAKKVPARTMN